MKLSDIDLRLLRVFKAVAESGGFVKAQAVLGISQPAISSHIANLERRLNVRLCHRGPKGFSLTFQGQQVLDETNRMLDHLDSFADRLNEIGGKDPAIDPHRGFGQSGNGSRESAGRCDQARLRPRQDDRADRRLRLS